ncbi:MAG: tetratricopeptide repeat protein [Desulfobacterales bacterium]|jgi:hypothetical protein
MDIKTTLRRILKEAELYQSQGLLNEAKENYKKATEVIRSNPDIRDGKALIDTIVKRVVQLNQEINQINEAISKPTVSDHKQELIKRLFTSSAADDPGAALLDGATTLAKFGQYERAINEFEPLLEDDRLKVTAAKNILRCLLELDDVGRATIVFDEWQSDGRFTSQQLEKIRFFANQRLTKTGHPALQAGTEPVETEVGSSPPEPVSTVQETVEPMPTQTPSPIDPGELASDDDVLDISSIGIRFESGPLDGQFFELDISFQSGNSLNLILPKTEQNLIDCLDVGTKLENIQFFSPIAILNGSGVVTSKNMIRSGPKEGNHSLDIAILK